MILEISPKQLTHFLVFVNNVKCVTEYVSK